MSAVEDYLEEYEEIAGLRINAANYASDNKREFPPAWYDWQQEGFDTLAPHAMTMAGNQTGKTWSAAYHDACDLTADYPDDWRGFMFEHSIDATVMGVDNTQLVDVIQKELFGMIDPDTNKFSGGWVHPDEILHFDRSQVSGLAKNVYVKSKYGKSKCALRAYTQSRTGSGSLPLAGTIKDLIHVDECPPDAIVGQLFMRTMNGNRGKGGRLRFTMTPELGVTELVNSFMEELGSGQVLIGPVAWDDCAHLTPEKQAQILVGIPEHEHDMRSKGIPFFGSGLIYPIAEDRIKIESFEIPSYFVVIRAIDLGIDHPQATAWLAYCRDTDIIYLVRDYSARGANAATHASATNAMWRDARCVIPHDYDTSEKGSGETVSKHYKDAGLRNTIPFKNEDGSLYVEPGIMSLKERMDDGRFKVFSTCEAFFREKRLYHRDNGKRVSKNDDVLDCVRQGAVMILKYGLPVTGRQAKPTVKRAMGRKRGR